MMCSITERLYVSVPLKASILQYVLLALLHVMLVMTKPFTGLEGIFFARNETRY
jgi:hypothetical protein